VTCLLLLLIGVDGSRDDVLVFVLVLIDFDRDFVGSRDDMPFVALEERIAARTEGLGIVG
jgi:hypothetical protein